MTLLDSGPTPEATRNASRAGYVTLLGRPNAGKSTLLNRLVGFRLSIVTSRAQTTWQRVTGIHTDDGTQLIFLDTPGLLEPRDLFQRSMLSEAREAIREADVLLLVVDATRRWEARTEATIREALAERTVPLLAAINKTDAASEGRVENFVREVVEKLDARPFPVSARTGEGVEALLEALRETLPESPFLYPEDDAASQPVRFFVAELVRETVFEQFHQEIPYSVFCVVDELRERQNPVYVGVTLYVEAASQKQILVGKRGAAIKAVGQKAREKIEHLLEEPVYLDLWVKALPGWRRKRDHLSRLGFRLPEDDR